MKNQTVRLNNEEIFSAFEDWLHGYLSAVFTEEKRTGCVSAVRAFAEFIAPEQLSGSTIAQIKAFEQEAKKNRRLSRSELRETLIGMGYFRGFREEFVKPRPPGKISGRDVRRRLAKAAVHRRFRG